MDPALIKFHHLHAATQKPVYASGLTTAHDIRKHSGLPWLPVRLPFTMPHETMLDEAKKLRECFVPHRTMKEANRGWASLCLHGLSSVHTGPHTRYGVTDLYYKWTDICRFCPVTYQFFKNSFGYHRYHRVRFMLLEPGGYVLPHNDSEVDELDAINIALNNPVDCGFVMEDAGTVPFQDGSVMMLSLSRRHVVWNQSHEDRYHIIVHGVRSSVWDQIILDSYLAL
jgi:hypothetical protein